MARACIESHRCLQWSAMSYREEERCGRAAAAWPCALRLLCLVMLVALSAGCGGAGTKHATATSAAAPAGANSSKSVVAQHRRATALRRSARVHLGRTTRQAQVRAAQVCGRHRGNALAAFARSVRPASRHDRLVVRGLLAQARRLPRRARGGRAGALLAAGLYAVREPVAVRAGVFSGCARALGVRVPVG